jgi:hypothetical protein
LDSLRHQIGFVTQEILLFNDTVRYNIAYGKPGASMEEIQEAAKAANAHAFIERLPQGYDTVIGERSTVPRHPVDRRKTHALRAIATSLGADDRHAQLQPGM